MAQSVVVARRCRARRGSNHWVTGDVVNHTLVQMYGWLPSSVQHLVCSLEGYRLQRARFGHDFGLVLREAEARSAKSAADIVALRDGLFRQFVSDAARVSAFYRGQPSFQSAAEG